MRAPHGCLAKQAQHNPIPPRALSGSFRSSSAPRLPPPCARPSAPLPMRTAHGPLADPLDSPAAPCSCPLTAHRPGLFVSLSSVLPASINTAAAPCSTLRSCPMAYVAIPPLSLHSSRKPCRVSLSGRSRKPASRPDQTALPTHCACCSSRFHRRQAPANVPPPDSIPAFRL